MRGMTLEATDRHLVYVRAPRRQSLVQGSVQLCPAIVTRFLWGTRGRLKGQRMDGQSSLTTLGHRSRNGLTVRPLRPARFPLNVHPASSSSPSSSARAPAGSVRATLKRVWANGCAIGNSVPSRQNASARSHWLCARLFDHAEKHVLRFLLAELRAYRYRTSNLVRCARRSDGPLAQRKRVKAERPSICTRFAPRKLS